jgi:DNA-binding NtrC family response regulator
VGSLRGRVWALHASVLDGKGLCVGSSPARILVYSEGTLAGTESLQAHLLGEGFRVSCAGNFFEAAPHLAPGRIDLFWCHLPRKKWVRDGLLAAARRANPNLPIIAIMATPGAPSMALRSRMHGATVLPVDVDWPTAVREIRRCLALTDARPEALRSTTDAADGGDP